jgi:hypothetical protein
MANTTHRNYPLPVAAHDVSDDVDVLIAALTAIDGDIDDLLEALSGKAAQVHGHSIENITGLQEALNQKASLNHTHSLDDLSDVAGASEAADGWFLVKNGAGWTPVSPAEAAGAHEHVIADVQNLETALNGKVETSWVGSAANFLTKAANKILTVVGIWDAAAEVTIPYASSVAVDFATLINGKITLTGNLTLAQPTNMKPGQGGCIRLIQDATGGRTVAFHSDWKFAGGTDPSASAAANKVDCLYYHCCASGFIHASLVKGVD